VQKYHQKISRPLLERILKVARTLADLEDKVIIEAGHVMGVIQYRTPVCKCPACGKKNTASFPREAAAPVQYGERISDQ